MAERSKDQTAPRLPFERRVAIAVVRLV
eukprot:SAG31_NODE_39406_length_288_cov_1.089947_1_plen_27_part_01